jgi:hypothetical protein
MCVCVCCCCPQAESLVAHLASDMAREGIEAKTLTLKLKTTAFEVCRSCTEVWVGCGDGGRVWTSEMHTALCISGRCTYSAACRACVGHLLALLHHDIASWYTALDGTPCSALPISTFMLHLPLRTPFLHLPTGAHTCRDPPQLRVQPCCHAATHPEAAAGRAAC